MLKLELGCGNSPTPGYAHHDRTTHAPHVDLAWDLRNFPWPFAPDGDAVVVPEAYTRPPYLFTGESVPGALTREAVKDGLRACSEQPSALEEEARIKAEIARARREHPMIVASYLPTSITLLPPAAAFLDEILALDVLEHVSAEIAPWLDECWRLLRPGGLLDVRLPAWDNPLSYRDPTHLRTFHRETFFYWDTDHELHRQFGSLYFAEAARWWAVEEPARENGDWRYRMRKRGGRR